jgi:hypothetical protein
MKSLVVFDRDETLAEGTSPLGGEVAGAFQETSVDSTVARDPSEGSGLIQTLLACLGDGSRQINAPGRES